MHVSDTSKGFALCHSYFQANSNFVNKIQPRQNLNTAKNKYRVYEVRLFKIRIPSSHGSIFGT